MESLIERESTIQYIVKQETVTRTEPEMLNLDKLPGDPDAIAQHALAYYSKTRNT